ncbi:putative toxin-antitoxin system antitoxin component, TIGR02293 family [Pseudarcicella hirudinis]|uniref:Putative toxin-antitoxin system antitoxin component, TIGR02293 family n=1 Tax=Pseudarcicella hirudinis TaxID=1079859 RepID=A0A1I5M2E1_9BACT|nr:antitoxin Xre/MbcA/ParS toxin-binding domain-containing protein [Pseudarcicella hirudinis]SFP03126.1 putative toxin-antitoxin system antitoxin component, TIGR02293 family [Pseudarcicella hirudinis]
MSATISNIETRLNREITAFLHSDRITNHQIEVNKSITYEGFLESKILIILAIRAGIPYSLFNLIQDYAPFTESDWADLLNISTKSLHRYKAFSGHYFKPVHSEKIIEMSEVTKVGLDVFGNIEKLRLWLNTPNYALGKLAPIELLKDSYGKEMVISELIRINHGILV